MTQHTLRASVTVAAQGLAPGDPAPILVDGADTPITANGLGGYLPMPGDRLLVQQVGGTVEVLQFVSVGTVPGQATFRQATAPPTTTSPLYAIWYDTSNSNRPARLEPDPTTGAPTWVLLTIDSTALDVPNVRAQVVEKGFVLGGGGIGVLSNGATNPTAGPVISNYWPQWNSQFWNNGSDDSQFWGGMTTYHGDSTHWITAVVFFGTDLKLMNKSDGVGGTTVSAGSSWASAFYAWGGIARAGSTYWLQGQDNDRSVDQYIYQIDGANGWVKSAEKRIGGPGAFGGVHPRLVSDGTRLGLVWIPSSGDLMLRWYAKDTFAQVGSDITLKTGVGQQNIGDASWGDNGSGLGANTLWVAIELDGTTLPNVMCWSNVTTTAATRQTTYDFKKPNGNSIHSMEFDTVTGHFQTIDKTGVVRETSQIAQVGGSSTSVTARDTFYDSDTGNYAGAPGSGTVIINGVDVSGTASTAHETGYSPTTTFTTARRAWVRITSPIHAPDETNLDSTKVDRANRIGFYTAIGGGTMWRQAYGTVGQVVVDGFDTFPTTGTPDAHTFATAQVALGVLESANTRADGLPKFYLDGAATQVYMDGLIAPGTVMMYAGATAPAGWYLCDGSSKTTAAEPDLFAATGYKFGGSGANFNLPDLRGRFPMGQGGVTGGKATIGDDETGASGTAPGASDTGRLNHQHTHGIAVTGNSTSAGASTQARITGVGGVTGANGTGVTDSQGVNGTNAQYHGFLTIGFIIKR